MSDSSGTPTDPPPPLPRSPVRPDELFKLDYKKQDDDVRHYSTTRSALTSFLMTVGLTLLAYYFSNSYPQGLWFLPTVGFLILTSALLVCGVFSFRTEKSWLHQQALWKWAKDGSPNYPQLGSIHSKQIWKAMAKDPMNYALAAVVIFIGIFFACQSRSTSDDKSSSAALSAKAAENSATTAAQSAQLADAASKAAREASRRATESAKSAEIAAGAARTAADQLAKRPQPVVQSARPFGGQSVAELQRNLLLFGFDPGPVDGREGRRTRRAASEFCRQTGIPFKGCQDRALIDALDSRLRDATK
jgi:hypothetical protein